MDELRFTDTNAADDSGGRVFGLDGNLYLPVVMAALGAIGIFILLGHLFHTGWVPATVGGAIPLALTLGWVGLLRHSRPSGYDRDKLEDLGGGGHFTRTTGGESHGREHAYAPEGRFVNGLLVFGSPERGGIAARGFALEPPDLRGASFARLNAFQEQVRGLLALIGPGRRLQVQWSCDSDYRRELLRYHAQTQDVPDAVIRPWR